MDSWSLAYQYSKKLSTKGDFTSSVTEEPRSFQNDFILYAGLSQEEGPVPMFTIPKDGADKFPLDSFVLRLMTLDGQAEPSTLGSESGAIIREKHGIISIPEESAVAYTYSTALRDIRARGYVRPLIIAYVSHDANKIVKMFCDLQKEFLTVSRILKQYNDQFFRYEVARRQAEIEYTLHLLEKTYRLQEAALQIEAERVQEAARKRMLQDLELEKSRGSQETGGGAGGGGDAAAGGEGAVDLVDFSNTAEPTPAGGEAGDGRPEAEGGVLMNPRPSFDAEAETHLLFGGLSERGLHPGSSGSEPTRSNLERVLTHLESVENAETCPAELVHVPLEGMLAETRELLRRTVLLRQVTGAQRLIPGAPPSAVAAPSGQAAAGGRSLGRGSGRRGDSAVSNVGGSQTSDGSDVEFAIEPYASQESKPALGPASLSDRERADLPVDKQPAWTILEAATVIEESRQSGEHTAAMNAPSSDAAGLPGGAADESSGGDSGTGDSTDFGSRGMAGNHAEMAAADGAHDESSMMDSLYVYEDSDSDGRGRRPRMFLPCHGAAELRTQLREIKEICMGSMAFNNAKARSEAILNKFRQPHYSFLTQADDMRLMTPFQTMFGFGGYPAINLSLDAGSGGSGRLGGGRRRRGSGLMLSGMGVPLGPGSFVQASPIMGPYRHSREPSRSSSGRGSGAEGAHYHLAHAGGRDDGGGAGGGSPASSVGDLSQFYDAADDFHAAPYRPAAGGGGGGGAWNVHQSAAAAGVHGGAGQGHHSRGNTDASEHRMHHSLGRATFALAAAGGGSLRTHTLGLLEHGVAGGGAAGGGRSAPRARTVNSTMGHLISPATHYTKRANATTSFGSLPQAIKNNSMPSSFQMTAWGGSARMPMRSPDTLSSQPSFYTPMESLFNMPMVIEAEQVPFALPFRWMKHEGPLGTNLMELRNRFSFLPHAVYALLTRRLLIVYGSDEAVVRGLVRALSVFVAGNDVQQVVVPWTSVTIGWQHVSRYRIIGLSKKVRWHRRVGWAVSVFDVDEGQLSTPEYRRGRIIPRLLALRRTWKSERSYLSSLHYELVRIAIYVFLYYHLVCVGVRTGASTSLRGKGIDTSGTLSPLLSRAGAAGAGAAAAGGGGAGPGSGGVAAAGTWPRQEPRTLARAQTGGAADSMHHPLMMLPPRARASASKPPPGGALRAGGSRARHLVKMNRKQLFSLLKIDSEDDMNIVSSLGEGVKDQILAGSVHSVAPVIKLDRVVCVRFENKLPSLSSRSKNR